MIRSPYDGHDRTAPRIALATVFAIDLIVLAFILGSRGRSSISHPFAPFWVTALGGRPWLTGAIAAVGVVAAVLFARRPGRVAPGLVMLLAGALLNESTAAVYEGPMRAFFSSGAALIGWLAGLAYARALGVSSKSQPRAVEALAELGACAGLAATYVGAFISKMADLGFSWADGISLQAMILSQHPIEWRGLLGRYLLFIAAHAGVTYVFALITLLAQLSAVAYPWTPRARAVSAAMLVAFHVNVYLLTPIPFFSPMILLLAFSYPWPRWIARLRGRATPATEIADAPSFGGTLTPRVKATLSGAVLVVAVLATLGWTAPLRVYTHAHHDGRFTCHQQPKPIPPRDPPERDDVRRLLGGLSVGDHRGDFLVVRVGAPEKGELQLDWQRSSGRGRVRVTIARTGHRGAPPPFASDRYGVFYDASESVTPSEREGLLREIATGLRTTETRFEVEGL